MRHIRIIDGAPRPYSLTQLRADHPAVSFPQAPSAALLAEYAVYELVESAPPAIDPLTETLVELDPVLIDGAWTQQWQAAQLTEEELQALRGGLSVSMRQARLALLQQGLLGQVEGALAALPDGAREPAQIEWEYGSRVDRLSPWVVQLTAGLGMTPSEVDQLFALARTL